MTAPATLPDLAQQALAAGIRTFRDAIERELAKGLCSQCGSGGGPFTVVEFPLEQCATSPKLALSFAILCADCERLFFPAALYS